MRVLIIGGTGFTGPHTVRRLLDAGHEVTVFHRGRTEGDLPPEVRHLHCPSAVMGDRTSFLDFADELRRLAPEVVLDMMAVTAADAETVTGLFRGVARRLVVASSQDVYQAYGIINGTEEAAIVPSPMSEDAPLRQRLYPYRTDPPRAADHPARWMDDYDKILVERTVLGTPELPGTVLRLPMIYGPDDRQRRMFAHLKRMVDGRPAILLEEGLAQWRWTRAYSENVAEALALAVMDDRAAGRVYNVGETEPLTMKEWVEAIAAAAGWTGRILIVPTDLLPEDMRTTINVRQDLVSTSRRIREELGYREPVDPRAGIARTAAWERAHPPEKFDPKQFDYPAEDAVFASLGG
jgi:nucleoside-diphosphate-sugar epimerase